VDEVKKIMSVVLSYFGNSTEICFRVLTAVFVQILVVFGCLHRAVCFVCSETSEVRSVIFGRLSVWGGERKGPISSTRYRIPA